VRACDRSRRGSPARRRGAASRAIATLDATTRASVGEVFKRATNIAKHATPGRARRPERRRARERDRPLRGVSAASASRADELAKKADYPAFFAEIASIAPVMEKYFLDVFVMCDDLGVRTVACA
jgi:glycyl-tRNA synthetase beta chain